LAQTSRHLRWVDLANVLLRLAVGLLGYLILVVLLDHWVVSGGLSNTGRVVTLLILIVSAIGYLYWFMVRPLLQPINPVYVAHTIEKSRSKVKNSLINFLFLRDQRPAVSEGVRDTVGHEAIERLDDFTPDSAVDRRHLIRWGYLFTGLVVLFGFYLILSPKNPLTSVARLFLPTAEIAVPSRVQFAEIAPGNTIVPIGQPVKISAIVRGLDDESPVRCLFTTADRQNVDQPIPMKIPAEGFRYECTLPPGPLGAQQPIEYRLIAGDAHSPTFTIGVEEPPEIKINSVRYDYPAYTNLPSKTTDQSDLIGIEGTKVTLQAESNVPLSQAQIDFDCRGVAIRSMLVDQAKATGRFVLRLNPDQPTEPLYRTYQLLIRDTDGRKNHRPTRHTIEVFADLPPTVAFVQPPPELIELPQNGQHQWDVKAADPDFGLRQVGLRIERAGLDLPVEPTLNLTDPTPAHSGPWQGEISFEPSRYRLKVGDQITYRVVAVDNKSPSPNRTSTARYKIVITEPIEKAPQEKTTDQLEGDRKDPDAQQKQDEQQEGQADQQKEDQTGQSDQQSEGQESQEQQPSDQQSTDDSESGQDDQPQKPGEKEDQRPSEEPSEPEPGDQGESPKPDDSTETEDKSPKAEQEPTDQPSEGDQQQKQPDQPSEEGQQQQGQQQEGQQQDGQKPTEGGQGGQEQEGQQPTDQPGSESAKPGDDRAGEGEPSAKKSTSKDGGQQDGDQQQPGQQQSDQRDTNGQPAADQPTEPIDGQSNPGDVFERVLKHREKTDPSPPDKKPTPAKPEPGKTDSGKPDDGTGEKPPAGDLPESETDEVPDDAKLRRSDRPSDGKPKPKADKGEVDTTDLKPSDGRPTDQQPDDDQPSIDGKKPQKPAPGQAEPPSDSTEPEPTAAEKAKPDSAKPDSSEGESPSQDGPDQPPTPDQRPSGEESKTLPTDPDKSAAPGQSPKRGKPSEPKSVETAAEKANREYAQKQTVLALEYLKDQLAADEPDERLLKSLGGWTRADLAQFVRRWESMRRAAAVETDQTGQAKNQWEEAIKSLGIARGRSELKASTETDESDSTRGTGRLAPPSSWQDQIRAYRKSIGQPRKNKTP
jgi:collagen type III alpha